MSRIQINDLNSSDFGFLSELTDEEMSGINGGCKGLWYLAAGAAFVLMFFL
jgi:bacteriocin-like protein